MKLFKKIENMFAASAFAEAGEFDTARTIAAEDVEDSHHSHEVTRVKTAKPAVSDRSHTLKGAGSES